PRAHADRRRRRAAGPRPPRRRPGQHHGHQPRRGEAVRLRHRQGDRAHLQDRDRRGKGNVGFMSPEQARGQAVDPRSDLFSLGLVMYYGLCNEQIYKGDGTFEQLLQAATGPTPEQLAKIDHLPLAGPIVRRALSVDPGLRYQSAAEFATVVAAYSTGAARVEAAALMQQMFGDELKPPTVG